MVTQLPTWFRFLLTLALLLPTVLPALAPSASTLALSSAFVSPLPPPIPTPLPATRLTLTLDADPAWAEPGEVVTFTVTAANPGSTPLTGLTLTDALPEGLRYVTGSAAGFTYAASARQLTWQPAAVTAGQAITGSFQARVQGLALGATVTNTVIAAAPGLVAPVNASATVDVVSPRNNEVWATPEHGGLLRATDDRILLRVPAGAVGKRTRFTYTPRPDRADLPDYLDAAFVLQAEDETRQSVRHFAIPLTLTYLVVEPLAKRFGFERLAFYTLDETTGNWHYVPSQANRSRRLLQATLEHFSLYAVGNNSAQFEFDPGQRIRGAQPQLFSGSLSYHYPFDLPPGRGGQTPQLGLTYSSSRHRADMGHYSLVGHGWDILGENYAVRNADNPDEITVVLNGQVHTIFPDYFRNKEDPFFIASSYNDGANPPAGHPEMTGYFTLTLTSRDGTIYDFGANRNAGEPLVYKWNDRYDGQWRLCEGGLAWLRLPLRRVRDRNGNEISYAWAAATTEQPGYHGGSDDEPQCSGYHYTRTIRLTGVSYNNGNNTVELTYDNPGPGQGRQDRPWYYERAGVHLFPIHKLIGVTVKAAGQVARRYTLTATNPGQPWDSPSQKPLELQQVVEMPGTAGAPLTTAFQYDSHAFSGLGDDAPCQYTYLTQINEPFGGQISFTATTHPSSCSAPRPPTIATRTVTDGVTGQSWTWQYQAEGWQDKAHGFGKVKTLWPNSNNGASGQRQLDEHYFHQADVRSEDLVLTHLAGREYLSQTCAASSITDNCVASTTQISTTTTWVSTTLGLPFTADDQNAPEAQKRRFVYAAEVQRYQAGVPLQRITYAYEPARQGGTNYGNVTQVQEFGGIAGGPAGFNPAPLRATYTEYYPATGAWILSKPARQRRYDGCEGCANSQLLRETVFYYDYAINHTTPPTKGRLTRQHVGLAPLWQETRYEYWEPNGNLRKVIDGNNHATETFYDSGFQAYPVCTVDAQGYKTTRQYYGVPGSTDALCLTPAGSAVSTAGAFFGQLETETDPNNATTTVRYTTRGWPAKVIRPNDDEPNPTVRYAYTDFGGANQPFWVKQEQKDNVPGAAAAYLARRTFYDGLGRVLQTQAEAASSSQRIVVSHEYNALDQVTRQNMPYFDGAPPGTYLTRNWSQPNTQTLYDTLGRTSAITQPDQRATRLYYSAGYEGDLPRLRRATIDANHHLTIADIDSFGRLRQVRQFTGTYPSALTAADPIWITAVATQARYEYNVADQLTAVYAPSNSHTVIAYDAAGRKIEMTDPDLGTWRYTYDAASNLATQTDARGVTLWFQYDNLNRLTQKRQTDGAGPLLAQYGYDEAQTGYANLGRRTRATAYEYRDSWGSSATLTHTLAQSYDARGRVQAATHMVDGVSYTTQYAYDAADRVVRVTYPDGEQVATTYGSQGQPNSLSSSLGVTLADSASYDAAGRLTNLRFPTGGSLVRRQVYYAWDQPQQGGRLWQLLVGTSATTADRLNLTYGYDAVGNVTSITDSGVQSSFSYDALDRLTSAYSQTFSYDSAGRLTSFAGLTYTPDSGHPHAVDLVNGVDRYDYDANGNQTTRNKGVANQEQVLTWDSENRLVAVTYTNRTTAGGSGGPPPALCNGVPCKRVYFPLVMQQTPAERYSYDADGARVRKETKTEVTRYIGPHFEVTVAITNSQVLTTTKYYDFGGQRIAVRQITPQTNTLSYLHGDHLGSTSVATSASGAKTSDVRYFAYGGQRTGNLFALPTDHAFTGQKLDRGTGLLYYGARYYDSGLGMFVSPDSIIPSPGDPLSLNRYAYVRNNPLVLQDPTGHGPECAQLVMAGGPQVGGALSVVCQLGMGLLQLAQTQGPRLVQLATALSEFAASGEGQVVLQLAQQANAAANQAMSQAGNTANPGGSPNDPWRWKPNYRGNYEEYYGVARDPNHQVHHVLPQQWRDVLTKANINVDDPRWLREVPRGVGELNTHQRYYTTRWGEFTNNLQGRTPTPQEIIRFAQQLEQEYIGKFGSTLYRQGEGLPTQIDWQALWTELNTALQRGGVR
jgi:RHS repeat-associated protein/uncharacterized repeat protein (TIGR01451 family)